MAASRSLAAAPNASVAAPGLYLRAIPAARNARVEDNSSVIACVVRSRNSWASSRTTASRLGRMGCDSTISIASNVWLVTTMSATCAASFALTAKQLCPNAHLSAPTHSRPETEFANQTFRSTSGASSRSPVASGSLIHSRRDLLCPSRAPNSIKNSPSGSACPLFIFCRQR